MTKFADNPDSLDESAVLSYAMLAEQWAQFEIEYPTDEHALRALHVMTGGPLECRHCRGSTVVITSGGRIIHCIECNKNTWLTAKTFFRNVRRPRAWLFAIWLIERGMLPSLPQFHRVASVAYSTAWNIFRKLGMVIDGRMLKNFVSVHSSAFMLAVSRRSRETPARAHPTCELEQTNQTEETNDPQSNPQEGVTSVAAAQSDASRPATPETCKLTEHETIVCDFLTPEPVHFDTLLQNSGLSTTQLSSALTMLELSGLATSLPGDWYARLSAIEHQPERRVLSPAMLPVHAKAPMIIDSVIAFIRRTFHGISRKYLQLLLAAYECRSDRIAWPLGALLTACQQSDPITEDEVLAYVSPMFVKVST